MSVILLDKKKLPARALVSFIMFIQREILLLLVNVLSPLNVWTTTTSVPEIGFSINSL